MGPTVFIPCPDRGDDTLGAKLLECRVGVIQHVVDVVVPGRPVVEVYAELCAVPSAGVQHRSGRDGHAIRGRCRGCQEGCRCQEEGDAREEQREEQEPPCLRIGRR